MSLWCCGAVVVGNVLQSTAQMPLAVWLTNDVGVQRNGHYQGLEQYFVKIVDDHLGKVFGTHLAAHDHWNII